MKQKTDVFNGANTQIDERNIETCLITFISFHQQRKLSQINYTFVKKIQWQDLNNNRKSKKQVIR